MKITIDTKEDSHEDMKHVLEMLTNLLKKETSSPALQGSMMSMFNSEPAVQEAEEVKTEEVPSPMNMYGSISNEPVIEQKSDTGPDFSSLINLTRHAQEERETEQEENSDGSEIEFF